VSRHALTVLQDKANDRRQSKTENPGEGCRGELASAGVRVCVAFIDGQKHERAQKLPSLLNLASTIQLSVRGWH